MPLVSIVMPSHNSENTISESIQSVIKQTFQDWELLIVDDKSTDGTWEIINNFSSLHQNIRKFRSEVNQGAGASRNLAIEKAEGRFIAFLDSDDIWEHEKLEEQISFMLKNNYPFTYTYYTGFDNQGDLNLIKSPKFTTYNKLIYSNVIGCLTAVYDTKHFGKKFMPLIRKRQDMGLWLELLKSTPKAYCLPKSLAKYRVDSGMTAKKSGVLNYQWRFYRDVLKLNLPRSALVFSVYAAKGALKQQAKKMAKLKRRRK